MPNWDDLRFFLAVWRAGTMAGAARALKVNQTTVSRRLVALEETLGVLLFDRTPEGFRITSAGKTIVETATRMEDTALTLERLVAGTDARMEGTVRIACSETLAVGFLVEGFAEFRAAHPGVTLVFVTGQPPINLLRREADLAIRLVKPTQSELIVRKLADAAWSLFTATSARPGARRAAASEELLAHDSFIGYDEELAATPPSQWLEEHVPPERIKVRCNSILAAAVSVRAGLGVGPLPVFLGDRDPALRRAVPGLISMNQAWLVIHPDLQGQARVRAVSDHVVSLFARHASLFNGSAPATVKSRGSAIRGQRNKKKRA